MSPENQGLEPTAARMAWQMHSGWSATRVYLWWRSNAPLTDPGFLDQALELAEEIRATSQRFAQLGPDEQLIEAYERPLPLDRPVGVRFAVEFAPVGGNPQYRTYAIDVLPTATRAEIEAEIQELVEEDVLAKYSSIAYLDPETGLARMTPVNVTLGPLPQRL